MNPLATVCSIHGTWLTPVAMRMLASVRHVEDFGGVVQHVAATQALLDCEPPGDAMALLHELQVHQVEIDLQQEELRRSQSELEAELIRQAALVERAPVGYMTIDASTVLFEINLAGARLLDASREDLLGKALKAFFTAASVAALQVLAVVSQRTNLAARPRFDGWAR
jgi:PAS domain-containing protein